MRSRWREPSAARKWATVEPVPSPTRAPFRTSMAAAWAAARFWSSVGSTPGQTLPGEPAAPPARRLPRMVQTARARLALWLAAGSRGDGGARAGTGDDPPGTPRRSPGLRDARPRLPGGRVALRVPPDPQPGHGRGRHPGGVPARVQSPRVLPA